MGMSRFANIPVNSSQIVAETFDFVAVLQKHQGSEERAAPSFPFAAGVNFDMMIRFESRSFLVAVNGQHFCTFNARREGAVAAVREMTIEGDVIITSIRIAV